MLLVRISDGQIGFLVGVFSQPILKQAPATMAADGRVVQSRPVPGTLISGCVAVGNQFVLTPIGEITPIYEMPEEGEDGEGTEGAAVESGTIAPPDPSAATGDPPREPEGEARTEA